MRLGRLLLLVFMGALVPGASATAQSSLPAWEPVTEARLLDPEDGDWMSYRRTYDVTGFSPLDEIDRDNVDELRLVWAYSVNDGNRWVPTPIVANGLMYVAEGSGRVLAFEAATGDVAWIHERAYPEDIRSIQAFGKHRGVAIHGDRIYWGTADGHLVALDARTGEQIWEVMTGDYRAQMGHSHPPLIVEGKILLGHSGGDLGARGTFLALDAETGEIVWTFYTVPAGPGDPGWESWTPRDIPPLGGAPWNTISYDPELRLVYVPTGQPYPWSALLRGPGDALYTNSIVALDVDTGELRWHFQLVPEDSWDRAAYEGMLVDLEIGGETRKALIQTSKLGWGVVLDRATGEFLHAFRTGYDNLVTGWSEEGRPTVNPDLIPVPEDMATGRVYEVCPYYHGGRDLNSPSFSPETGLYYLGVNNTCMDISFRDQIVRPGSLSSGLTAVPKLVPGYDWVGEFVAFDPVTGERAWEYRPRSGSAMTAASLATRGGVVFSGTADREFFALDAESGELLWETRLNGDVSGAPITFELDGKQYLAVGAGGRIAQTVTYAPLTGTQLSEGSGVIWVFALP